MGSSAVSQVLRKAELDALVAGSAVLGCGGGGPVKVGQLLEQVILSQRNEIEVAPLADVNDEDLVVAMGVAAAENATMPEHLDPIGLASHAFDLLQQHEQQAFKYVLPLELGAGSSLVPMLVSAARGVPVLDAAGARRAVPLLNMSTFATLDPGPLAITNGTQDHIFHPVDADAAEADFRQLLSSKKFPFGVFAIWPLRGSQVKRVAIDKSLSYAIDLGNALIAAGDGKATVDAALKYLSGSICITGSVATVENDHTDRGLEVGTIHVTAGKESVRVLHLNENIAVLLADGAPLVTGPNLISCFGKDGEALTNGTLDRGTEVTIVTAPPPEKMDSEPIKRAFHAAYTEARRASR